MTEESDKETLNQVVLVVSKGKQVYLFIKKYWYFHGIIAILLSAGVDQYKELKSTEKDIKPMRDSLKAIYKQDDSLKIVITSIRDQVVRNGQGHRRDSVFIDYIYNYKQPYDTWGNIK